jgi:hypothetical protein
MTEHEWLRDEDCGNSRRASSFLLAITTTTSILFVIIKGMIEQRE